MITDVLIAVVLKVVSPILALLKPLNIVVQSEAIEYVFEVVSGILYFLPMGTVNTILAITLTTWIIRVIISFLRALWSILPIV